VVVVVVVAFGTAVLLEQVEQVAVVPREHLADQIMATAELLIRAAAVVAPPT
jgi:hypothetical protein